jgi:hypothetical protein
MRKTVIVLLVVFAVFTTVSWAQMPGWDMMGPGMRSPWAMMAPGWGAMPPGIGSAYFRQCNDFLDNTKDLRKELLLKRFDYFEAVRDPDTPLDTIMDLEQDIENLMAQLYVEMPAECVPW